MSAARFAMVRGAASLEKEGKPVELEHVPSVARALPHPSGTAPKVRL